MSKEIELTQGYKAIVDDEDFDFLNQWKWYVWKHKKHLYAIRSIAVKGKNAMTVHMHRVIMGLSDPKILVDHKDHNGLNNQKSNLRNCTRHENLKNRASKTGSTSKYVGVSWYSRDGVWKAAVSGKHIGYFESEEAAALAYNNASIISKGEFANLNVI